MRHRILECIKQNKSQFIINENNKGQLDETYLRENFKGNHTKSTDFSILENQERMVMHQNLLVQVMNKYV